LTGPNGEEWNMYDDYNEATEAIKDIIGFNWYFIGD
jgi:hypothetical protein